MESVSPNPISSRPSQKEENRSQPIEVLVWRALRLKCPVCGRGPIFRGWFAMNDTCAACGRRFNRDPGYLLGSIYFNYGITASIIVVMYFAMFFGNILTDTQRLIALVAFAALFPTWFFRYARALWMAFDERWDPWPNEEEARQMAGHERNTRNEERDNEQN
jgi:uncharacterized protein (DUF983 family)